MTSSSASFWFARANGRAPFSAGTTWSVTGAPQSGAWSSSWRRIISRRWTSGWDSYFRHNRPRVDGRDSGWAHRRTLTVDADSAGKHSCAESGLAVALRGFRAVHGARVPLCPGQLDLGDAAPGGHPLARYVLCAGCLTVGDSAVN